MMGGDMERSGEREGGGGRQETHEKSIRRREDPKECRERRRSPREEMTGESMKWLGAARRSDRQDIHIRVMQSGANKCATTASTHP